MKKIIVLISSINNHLYTSIFQDTLVWYSLLFFTACSAIITVSIAGV